MSDFSIAIAGGRTGGHLYPALAVARSLKTMRSDLNVYMIGTSDGMEARIVPESGFEFHAVSAVPLRRSLHPKNLAIPFVLALGTLQSYMLLKRTKAAMLLSTGGFPCVPVLIAARIAGVRIFLQEQNSYPGLTTRLFARKAETVFAAYQSIEDFLHPDAKVVQTGNPLRPGFEVGDRDEGVTCFGLDESRKTLLVFGGSQGAQALNRLISDNLDRIAARDDLQLIWQTGIADYDDCSDRFRQSGVAGVVLPFIDRMDLAYACADLTISRSGALTLAELAAAGKPAILVPYPFAAENHQVYNARLVEKKGAAILVRQDLIEESDPIGIAFKLLSDDRELSRMAANSQKLHRPGASDIIAGALLAEVIQ